MKGSSRSVMKEDNPSSGKTRIGTRSAGRRSLSPSKGARLTKTGTRSPRILAPKSPRIISPGSSFGRLRANRARLEKDKVETPKIQKTPDTTSKHVVTPKSEPVAQASQSSQGSQGSQSAPNTPQGAGIRTRLSTGSIQMNGTMTISSAKEKAEMDQIIKQIAKSDTVAPTTKTPPVSLKKRTSQMALLPHEGLLSDHPPPKRRKIGRNDGSGEDNRNDYFCWLCHKEGSLVCCELCPRVYHTRCLGLSASLPNDWVCPECEKIMRAECVDTRSKSMEMLTIEQTCLLLKYAVERMKHAGSEPFQNPVDLSTVPNYSDYIFHPMDITTLEKNIKNKMYGCTEALLADTKWILHNCIIYNGAHNKLTGSAKMIIKICKHEMNEIELCPDCYLNSCMRKNDDWFSETCRVPHTLVWAKLKGYPFWPSKALREVDGQVDVRFFGAHDRSWVPVSQCFLLSKNIPTSLQKGRKNNGLDMAIEELNLHVKKIREKFGGFEYAPFRTPYDKTDSYKPISIKSELESKPNPVRLIQNREVKTSSGSNFSSHKSNILRKSAVAKTASALRNKYNAMVSLKKLDMTPEKVKKKSHLEEGSASDDLVEKCAVPIQTDDSNDIVVKLDPDALENKELGSIADTGVKESKLGKDNTPEKVIKKSFVSSSLIERLENKLKALDDETVAATDSKEIKAEILDETHLEHVSSDTEKDKLHSKAQVIVKVEVTNDKDDESIFERDLKSEVEHRDSAVIEEVDKIEGNAKNEESSPSDNEITDKNESEKSNAGTEKNDTESKDSYRRKLDVMIKSCKEKLGMNKEDDESAISDDDYEVSSAESDENESQQSDNEEESMDGDNNEEKEKEGSEMEGVGDIPKTDFKGVLDAKSCVTVAETVEPSASEVMEQQNSDNVTNDKDSTRELENKNGNKMSEGEVETSENMDMTTSSSKHEPETKYTGVCKESDEANEEVNDLISSDISEDKFDTLTQSAESIHKLKSPEHGKNKQHGSCSTEEITDQPISENEDRLTLSPNSTTASKLSSNLHASVTLVQKMKIMLSKVLDPLSGEMMDKTTTDEDSDADRLVIDLEEESEHNLSKNRTQVIESAEKKQYKHGTTIVSSPSPEKMNLTEEVDKDTERRNIEEKTRHSSEHVEGSSQSSEPEESTQSNKRKYRTPSRELEESTQSNESEDGTQSAEHENRTLSGEEERPESSEKMNMDVEVLENLSSPALNMDSSLPDKNFVRPPPVLNMDSSLPDKNFVRLPPGLTESSVEKPSSSKMAEKFSKKLLETIQTTMDEMCSDVLKEANDMRSADVLSQQLSQARWSFCSELNELKHNFQLTMYEMKSGWETEKEQIIKSLTAKHQTDKEQAVKEAKKKQWCAQCGKEAIFYCCWNTSYCDYPCQQGHWPQHMHTCLQTNKDKTGAVSISQGQGHAVSQSTSSIPVIGASATPQISVPSATPPVEGDHLRRLQENISMALHREEEKRGETRLGVSKKFVPPMSSPVMQNIRQPGLGSTSMMFNMQSPSPAGVMQQMQRTRFIGQQQMAMQVQQRSGLSQSQQGNPRMLFSQPLIQQAIYPLQVQPQQQLGGTILFQNPQQNLMTYGMPRPPY